MSRHWQLLLSAGVIFVSCDKMECAFLKKKSITVRLGVRDPM